MAIKTTTDLQNWLKTSSLHEYELIGEYGGCRSEITLQHTCGAIRTYSSISALKNNKTGRCKNCQPNSTQLTHEQFLEKTKTNRGDFQDWEILSNYRGGSSPIELRHSPCGKEMAINALSFSQGIGNCRYCAPQKRREYCQQNFGVDNVSQLQEIKDKKQRKAQETYGVDNVFQAEEIKQKLKATNLEKYGVEYASQNSEIKKKIAASNRQTFMHKYGVLNAGQIGKETWQAVAIDTKENFIEFLETLELPITPKKIAIELGYINATHVRQLIHKFELEDICGIQYGSSEEEDELCQFIKSLLPDDEIIQGARDIIINPETGKSLEIDIYIPRLKIGFEFDGLYWHCEKYHEHYYHLRKTEFAEEKGIRLIHIFEDEWINKQNIVKQRISSLLCSKRKRIFAKQTIIKQIEVSEAKDFVKNNHIQGFIGCKVHYGVFHNGEIVGYAGFSKPRASIGSKSNSSYELVRFCTSLTIVGCLNKIISSFHKDHPEINKIFSYADRRWTSKDNNIYNKSGFELVSTSSPNYFYIPPGFHERRNRIQFQKHKLRRIFGDKVDMSLTEKENMLQFGYNIIYDCGNFKYEKLIS